MRLWYVPKGKGIRDQGSRVTDGIFTADSTAVHGNETAALGAPQCDSAKAALVGSLAPLGQLVTPEAVAAGLIAD